MTGITINLLFINQNYLVQVHPHKERMEIVIWWFTFYLLIFRVDTECCISNKKALPLRTYPLARHYHDSTGKVKV